MYQFHEGLPSRAELASAFKHNRFGDLLPSLHEKSLLAFKDYWLANCFTNRLKVRPANIAGYIRITRIFQ
jgi:hypothetical protein